LVETSQGIENLSEIVVHTRRQWVEPLAEQPLSHRLLGPRARTAQHQPVPTVCRRVVRVFGNRPQEIALGLPPIGSVLLKHDLPKGGMGFGQPTIDLESS